MEILSSSRMMAFVCIHTIVHELNVTKKLVKNNNI